MIISIGYAACHWCHVMEHESFEDEEVAAVMNQDFISIKVDREERPDVDQIYINAVQLMTGSAGWPLNVVTLPDGRDRKSTRLNSSHVRISYAVFCLKKKNHDTPSSVKYPCRETRIPIVLVWPTFFLLYCSPIS